MKEFLSNIRGINMDALTGKGSGMAKSFLEMAASKEFTTADSEAVNAALVLFFGELKKPVRNLATAVLPKYCA